MKGDLAIVGGGVAGLLSAADGGAGAESLGAHHRADAPAEGPVPAAIHVVLRPGQEPVLERWE